MTCRWILPCLLHGRDLDTLACKWNSQAYRLAGKHAHDKSFSHRRSSRSSTNLTALNADSSSSGERVWDRMLSYSPVGKESGKGGHAPSGVKKVDSSASSFEQGVQRGLLKLRLVEDTFKQLFKDDYHAVVPVRNFQPVDELLRQWNFDMQVKGGNLELCTYMPAGGALEQWL